MWDWFVAVLVTITVFSVGRALVVDGMAKQGWNRSGPSGHLSNPWAGRKGFFGTERFRLLADRIDRNEWQLKVVGFMAAAAAAGIQVIRTWVEAFL